MTPKHSGVEIRGSLGERAVAIRLTGAQAVAIGTTLIACAAAVTDRAGDRLAAIPSSIAVRPADPAHLAARTRPNGGMDTHHTGRAGGLDHTWARVRGAAREVRRPDGHTAATSGARNPDRSPRLAGPPAWPDTSRTSPPRPVRSATQGPRGGVGRVVTATVGVVATVLFGKLGARIPAVNTHGLHPV
jgi:hypothetical protein